MRTNFVYFHESHFKAGKEAAQDKWIQSEKLIHLAKRHIVSVEEWDNQSLLIMIRDIHKREYMVTGNEAQSVLVQLQD